MVGGLAVSINSTRKVRPYTYGSFHASFQMTLRTLSLRIARIADSWMTFLYPYGAQ
jgi:hypothetical protein